MSWKILDKIGLAGIPDDIKTIVWWLHLAGAAMLALLWWALDVVREMPGPMLAGFLVAAFIAAFALLKLLARGITSVVGRIRPKPDQTTLAARDELVAAIKFNPRTIVIEPHSIDITKLRDTEPCIGFNFFVGSVQWPLEINSVSGVIHSLGKDFVLPLRAPRLPIPISSINDRWGMLIEQPVSPERAAEVLGFLLGDGSMVSFSFDKVKIEGTVHLPGREENFVAYLYQSFEIKGPMPDIGEDSNMVMMVKMMVSQVIYDQYGNKRKEANSAR
ncbi:MAG: hypothetical protein ABID84_01880 [Chloroflexota bacterium]